MKTRRFTTIAFCSSLAISGTLKGAVTAQDAFDYTVGSNNLSGQGTAGNGWAGAWGNPITDGTKSVTTGSLDSPVSTSEIGNKASIVGTTTASSSIFRTLSSSITTGTYYVGFIFRNNTDSIRTTGLSLFDTTATEKLFLGISGVEGTRKLLFATAAQSGTTATTAVNGTAYQFVLRVDMNATGNETLNLYLNQASEGIANATNSAIDFGASGFNTVRLFSGGTSGGNAFQNSDFDEIRIATTYAEAIPEPSAALLLGSLGGLALLRRRRG